VSTARAESLLQCLRTSGAIAAVFSRPSTHQTLQLKGVDAAVTPARGRRSRAHRGVSRLVRRGIDQDRAPAGLCHGGDLGAHRGVRRHPGAERRPAAEGVSMAITPDSIRACFEGSIPSAIATCAPDGTPNVAYLSQVHYVDHEHVALSFQFFNKTRENVLANPRATVQVVDSETAAQYLLSLQCLRTETEGPVFENMKAH